MRKLSKNNLVIIFRGSELECISNPQRKCLQFLIIVQQVAVINYKY